MRKEKLPSHERAMAASRRDHRKVRESFLDWAGLAVLMLVVTTVVIALSSAPNRVAVGWVFVALAAWMALSGLGMFAYKRRALRRKRRLPAHELEDEYMQWMYRALSLHVLAAVFLSAARWAFFVLLALSVPLLLVGLRQLLGGMLDERVARHHQAKRSPPPPTAPSPPVAAAHLAVALVNGLLVTGGAVVLAAALPQ
jgi:hypothetical protein